MVGQPMPCRIRRVEKTDEVGNPKGEGILEREYLHPQWKTLRCNCGGQQATAAEKRERGRPRLGAHLGEAARGGHRSGQEAPKGRNHMEATARYLANTQGPGRDLCGVLSPEEGRSSRFISTMGANFKRAAAFERAYGYARGVKPRNGKSQGRIRDEIGLAGHGESKASKSFESSRAQHNRSVGTLRRYVARCGWEDVEGKKTSEGATSSIR
jgi:hypothetical protein